MSVEEIRHLLDDTRQRINDLYGALLMEYLKQLKTKGKKNGQH